jgi:hypothetical protein
VISDQTSHPYASRVDSTEPQLPNRHTGYYHRSEGATGKVHLT